MGLRKGKKVGKRHEIMKFYYLQIPGFHLQSIMEGMPAVVNML